MDDNHNNMKQPVQNIVVSAHQPNFMPWLGFFIKMKLADKFILANDVQFSKHDYTNRVRIKTATGPQWLTVPVFTRGKGPQQIRDVRIDNSQNWQKKQIRTLQHHYKYTPFFDHYIPDLQKYLDKDWEFLLDLNMQLIEFFRHELSLKTPIHFGSDFNVPEGPTERIVKLVQKTGGTTYLAGESSRTYLNQQYFKDNHIQLKFHSFIHPEYHQIGNDFIPGLSIIDLLFNEGPNTLNVLKKAGG